MVKTSTAVSTVDPSSLDYVVSVSLKSAFYVFEVKFEINGIPLPQTCRISLVNGPVDVTKSEAQLLQQNRYLGHNDCVFASELIYVLLTLRDSFGNAVPLDDHDSFHDAFSFVFELGSEFSNRDCKQYGPIGSLESN
jgi:hypothetical protein